MPNWDGKLIYWNLATVVVKGVDMACNLSQSSILLFKFQRTNGTMELIPIQYFEPITGQMTSGGHSHSGLWTNLRADDVTYRILVCNKMAPLDCEQSLFFVRFSESSARAREGQSRETRETRAATREKEKRLPAKPEPMKYALASQLKNTIGGWVKRWQQPVNNRKWWLKHCRNVCPKTEALEGHISG